MAPQLPSRRQWFLIAILLIVLTLTAWWVVDHNIQESGFAERQSLLLPRVIDMQPATGDELGLNGHVEFAFDQPMDPASVERAIALDPALPYHTLWPDPETLWIVPEAGALKPASRFTVHIYTSASSVDHRSLVEPVKLDVEVTGFLKATDFSPADGSPDVPVDSTIRVVFNRPVVALMSTGPTTQPSPLGFTPDIPGAGEWVNSSIFVWHPSGKLLSGQKYTVSLSPGLSALAGAPLDKEYSWSFSIASPSVVSIDPSYQSDQYYHPDYAPDTPVHVTFTQPMDHQSAEQAFSLSHHAGPSNDTPVAGTFSWNDDSTRMTFKASSLLVLGADYTIDVAETARSFDRNAQLNSSDSAFFTVVSPPEITDTDLGYNNRGVAAPDVQLSLVFNTLMNEDTITAPGRVTISPEPLGPINLTVDAYRYSSLRVSTRLKSHTTYTLIVNPGAQDVYGNTITTPYQTTFTTVAPNPIYQVNNNEHYGVYDASQPVRILLATRNEQIIHLRLYRIPQTDYSNLLEGEYHPELSGELVHDDWKVYPQGPDYETVVQAVNVAPDGGTLAPGIYALNSYDATSQYDQFYYLFVVNASLTYKYSFDQSMVWLTDLRSGQPIPNAQVELRQSSYRNSQGQTVGGETLTSTTAGDGTASFAAGANMQDYYYRSYYYYRSVDSYAVVDDGTTFAVGLPGWNDGIGPSDFGVSQAQYQTN